MLEYAPINLVSNPYIYHSVLGFGIGFYLSAEIIQHYGREIKAPSEESNVSTYEFTLTAV